MRRRELLMWFIYGVPLGLIIDGSKVAGAVEGGAPGNPAPKYRRAIRAGLPGLRISDLEIAKFQRACEQAKLRFPKARIIEELSTRFLMSSDFFRNGEDPKQAVHFVAVYGPYVNPCFNPMPGGTS